jgi:hypothetical protein
MKKEMSLKNIYYWVLPVLVLFSINSCKKDNSMGFTPGTGKPTITYVRTVYKSKVDTAVTKIGTYSSY